jgi:hypothetical protein
MAGRTDVEAEGAKAATVVAVKANRTVVFILCVCELLLLLLLLLLRCQREEGSLPRRRVEGWKPTRQHSLVNEEYRTRRVTERGCKGGLMGSEGQVARREEGRLMAG